MRKYSSDELATLKTLAFWPHLATTVGAPIVQAIERDWLKLLSREDANESEYHHYLRKHAGFFFGEGNDQRLVLSKIRLGSDLETDFVVCYDAGSRGFLYQFVEIEVPNVPPFTRRGQPHTRLTHALQQIEDWRQWLDANRPEAKRLFPSQEFLDRDRPYFNFAVVIGNRDNSRCQLQKRNALAERMNVSIRSFDSFTDTVRNRMYPPLANRLTKLMKPLDVELLHEMANPFYQAFGHSDWKRLLEEPSFERRHHMLESNAHLVLHHRSLNSKHTEFMRTWERLPADERIYYGLWLQVRPR